MSSSTNPEKPDRKPRPQATGNNSDLIKRFTAFSRSKAVRETTITVLIAVLLFVGIRSVANASEVNGTSMLPNLHDGERVIVSKVAYWLGDPHRGDIVVFKKDDRNYDVIHRIVGLPGERVEIRQGKVYINGKLLEEPYAQGDRVSESARVLDDDEYLIVGDNRYVSAIDVVTKGEIIGKAWISYWPVGDWGTAPNYSDYPDLSPSTP